MRTLMRDTAMKTNRVAAALEATLWSRPKLRSKSITNDSNLFKMKLI